MKKKKWVAVSFSGGKDSTAMLLRMMELGEHIDEVVCCDTYKEFPAMYRHIAKVKETVEANGIKFTELRNDESFDYLMFEKSKTRGKFAHQSGRGWPSPMVRWCTGELKRDVVRRHFGKLSKLYDVIQCIGIAADEAYRLERENNQNANHRHPLVEWGWDEETCLKYCYDHGYDWEGLYRIFGRVSCWCCPLRGIGEQRKLWKHFPDLWEELKDMDNRTWNQFRADYSVDDLEKRFEFEEERLAQGLSITNRDFHNKLKERLAAQGESRCTT